MKQHILIGALMAAICIFSMQSMAQDCSDLFISEYVVGTDNNRALELYNPTSEPIDLGLYEVGRFRDGSGTPMLLPLSDTIAAYGTYVIVLDKRDPNGIGLETPIDPALEAVADTFVNPVYVQADSPFYFNGDDAIILAQIPAEPSTIKDIIGKIGQDPGVAWNDANGIPWTVNKTLVRKPTVLQGDINGLNAFLPEVEWDSLPINTFTSLGWHTCDCSPMVGIVETAPERINLFPDPASDKGLMLSASKPIDRVEVIGLNGEMAELIALKEKGLDQTILDLTRHTTGLYAVRVTLISGTVITQKVILR